MMNGIYNRGLKYAVDKLCFNILVYNWLIMYNVGCIKTLVVKLDSSKYLSLALLLFWNKHNLVLNVRLCFSTEKPLSH